MIEPGTKFGRLTVLEFLGRASNRKGLYYCKCDCGNFTEVVDSSLLDGKTKSCGCYNIEKVTKHGLSKSLIYKVYNHMAERCCNPKCKHYKNYGGRGITICKEWMDDLKSFYDWCQSNGYQSNLQIDRIDNTKGYSPENCRFVTCRKNVLNQRLIISTNKTGYRGVSISKSGRFESNITIHTLQYYLGVYSTPREAAIARDRYIIDHNLQNEYKLQVLKA